jgi:hypothetical protein
MEWNKTYGGTDTDVAYSLVNTSDGGYALAGYTTSFGAGNEDFWLVKTAASGNEEWSRTYGGEKFDRAYALVSTSDGGYAVAGYTNSFADLDDYGNFWLIKTDADGNAEWNRTYGGIDTDVAYALVATADGGYALAGYTWSFGAGQHDFWLVKTDADGNMEWNQTYGGMGGDLASSLVETSDGGYALAGDTSSFGPAWDNFWLVKTNSTGNIEWGQTYGGNGFDEVSSLVETSEGGYAIAGYTDSYGVGGDDFFLVKTDEFGYIPEYSSLLLPLILFVATSIILISKKKLINQRS